MDGTNYNQYCTTSSNDSSSRLKSNRFDSQRSYSNMVRVPFYQSTAFRPASLALGLHRISTDSGICDRMFNCHLTDTWTGYMNQQINLPITQISNDIPILNSYVPMRMPIELQTTTNGVSKGPAHHLSAFPNDEYLKNVYCANHLKSDDMRSMIHPQQQLLQDGFSRLAELNYEPQSDNRQYDTSLMTTPAAEKIAHADQVHSRIKFQDRNKKLDFKVNFRDENRKANGCFHREVSKSLSTAGPPKKKWIRHYMTGNSQANLYT